MPHPLGDNSTLTQRRTMPHHVGMPNTRLPLRSTQLSLRGERVLEDISRSCNHQHSLSAREAFSTRPSLSQKYSYFVLASGLVKISTICSCVGRYCTCIAQVYCMCRKVLHVYVYCVGRYCTSIFNFTKIRYKCALQVFNLPFLTKSEILLRTIETQSQTAKETSLRSVLQKHEDSTCKRRGLHRNFGLKERGFLQKNFGLPASEVRCLISSLDHLLSIFAESSSWCQN
jgi:hypothetical protein